MAFPERVGAINSWDNVVVNPKPPRASPSTQSLPTRNVEVNI